jgi:hypothetical protein
MQPNPASGLRFPSFRSVVTAYRNASYIARAMTFAISNTNMMFFALSPVRLLHVQ